MKQREQGDAESQRHTDVAAANSLATSNPGQSFHGPVLNKADTKGGVFAFSLFTKLMSAIYAQWQTFPHKPFQIFHYTSHAASNWSRPNCKARTPISSTSTTVKPEIRVQPNFLGNQVVGDMVKP